MGIINNVYETYFKDKTARAVYDENHPLDRQRWEQQEQNVREQIAEDARLTTIEKEAAEKKAEAEKIQKEADAEKERLAKETREREQAKVDARKKAQEKRQRDAVEKQAATDAAQLEAAKLEAERLQREAIEKAPAEARDKANDDARKKAEIDAAWAAQEAQGRVEAEQAARDEADKIKREAEEETARLKAEAERIEREAKEAETIAQEKAERVAAAKKDMVQLRRTLGSTEYWKDPTPSRDALQRALDNLEMDFPDLNEAQKDTRTKIEEHLEPAEKAEFRELLAKYFELKKIAGLPPPEKQPEKTKREKRLVEILKQLDNKEFWKKGDPGVEFADALALLAGDPAMEAKFGQELQAKKKSVEGFLNLGSFDSHRKFTKLLDEWEATKNTPEDALERFSANKEAMKMQWDLDQILAENEESSGSGLYITGAETEAEFRKNIPKDKVDDVMRIANHIKEFYEGAEWMTPAKKAAKLEEEKRAVDEAKKAQDALAVEQAEKEAKRKKLEDEAAERQRQADAIDAEILAKEAEEAAKKSAEAKTKLSPLFAHLGIELAELVAGHKRNLDAFLAEKSALIEAETELLSDAEKASYFEQLDQAVALAKKNKFEMIAKEFHDGITKEIAEHSRIHPNSRTRISKERLTEVKDNFIWELRQLLPFDAWQKEYNELCKALGVKQEELKREKYEKHS